MEPAIRAGSVATHLPLLQQLVRSFSGRARIHDAFIEQDQAEALAAHVDDLAQELLSKWCDIATRCANEGSTLSYQKFEGKRQGEALIRDFLDQELETKDPIFRRFRANRSMRDVEAAVDILPTKSSIRTNQ